MRIDTLICGTKKPGQRSRLWLFFAIVMTFGIPGFACAVPLANFTYGDSAGNVIFVDGSPSSDPAGIARYTWNFGDGSQEISSPVPTAYHLYQAEGTYPVTLKVTSRAIPPETGTVTKQVPATLFPVCTPPPCEPPGSYTCPPGSYASCPGGCDTQCINGTLIPYTDFTYRILGDNVVLYDASLSHSPDGIATYAWDFGDGSGEVSSPEPLITHDYRVEGTYWVRLRVTNRASPPVSFTITKEVTVDWFVCTPPPCTPPGTLACPTLGCPGGCGVECQAEAPLGMFPVMAALAGITLICFRRRST